MGCLLAAALPGFACEFPNEGATPLRRAVTRVEMLPEVHAWTVDLYEKGAARPQFVVRLDQPVWKGKLCYWPVEVRARGELWRSYLVSPDGKSVRPRE